MHNFIPSFTSRLRPKICSILWFRALHLDEVKLFPTSHSDDFLCELVMLLIFALGLGRGFLQEGYVYLLLSHSLMESLTEVSYPRGAFATINEIT